MGPNGFLVGSRRHAECPTDALVYVGKFGKHGPLDVCTACWMIVARTGAAPQDASPPPCAGCGVTLAYGLTRLDDQRWWWDCPMCSAANPGRYKRDVYVGTWVPDGGWPDEVVLWYPATGYTVDDLPDDDPLSIVDAAVEWSGYTWGNNGTELLFDRADGLRLVVAYPNRGGTVIARLVIPAEQRVFRVTLTPERRPRVRALIEGKLASLHERLTDSDLDGAINTRRLAQAWVRLG